MIDDDYTISFTIDNPDVVDNLKSLQLQLQIQNELLQYYRDMEWRRWAHSTNTLLLELFN